jgi:hypothetical protein
MSVFTFFDKSLLNPLGLMKPWAGPNGQTFREVIAGELDMVAVAAQQVADSRNVMVCDASVLPAHAVDRQIRRYITESELSWRKRLAAWLAIWQSAGGAWCILRQLRILLEPYGRPEICFVSTTGDGNISNWFTLAPGDGVNDYFEADGLDPEFTNHQESPANFDWDGNFAAWSRFAIIIRMDGITSPDVSAGEWDGASLWDGVNVWDGGLSNPVVQDILSLATEWKAAGSRCDFILFTADNTVLSPTGTSSIVAPTNYTTMPDGDWDQVNKRNPNVIFSYVRP